MTPLNELLIQAIEMAKREEPGLTEPEIARRSGLAQPALSRAKRACGGATLAAVLDALGCDLVVKKQKKASK
jgi:DNA-binding phage protein